MLIDKLKREYEENKKGANSLYEKLEQYRKLQNEYREETQRLEKLENFILSAIMESEEYVEIVELANEHDVGNIFWEFGAVLSDRRIVEDDGTLHIQIGELRFCFISNQDITQAEWNKQARPIVKDFGFSWKELKL